MSPLDVAFGAGFTAGDFNVKLRFSGLFLGKDTNITTGDILSKNSAMLGFGLYPNYKVTGNLLVGVGFDVMVHGLGEDAAGEPFEKTVRWHASPAVQYSVGPGTFQVGMNIGAPNGEEKTLVWEVPVRLAYSF